MPARTQHISEHTASGEKLSLLAVFAHPEDEALGLAGTLAKYANEGVHVSLTTATREPRRSTDLALQPADDCRDRSCACRTSGVRRECFLDYQTGELIRIDPILIEEQIVRLIREVRPQVVITYAARGIGDDADHEVINRVTTAAFHHAGDSVQFPRHLGEGLAVYAPQKLYYCLLPADLVAASGVARVTVEQRITTVLDVSAHSQSMTHSLHCQRNGAPDFVQLLGNNPDPNWDTEYYTLAESRLNKKPRREKDLFAGLR